MKFLVDLDGREQHYVSGQFVIEVPDDTTEDELDRLIATDLDDLAVRGGWEIDDSDGIELENISALEKTSEEKVADLTLIRDEDGDFVVSN